MYSVSLPSPIAPPPTIGGMPPRMIPHVESPSFSRSTYDTHVTMDDGSVVPVGSGAQAYHVSTSGISRVFPVVVIDRPAASSSTGPPITSQVI